MADPDGKALYDAKSKDTDMPVFALVIADFIHDLSWMKSTWPITPARSVA